MNNTIAFEYEFPLPNGLHARPASAIMDMVKKLGCEISITNLRNQKEADTQSVLSMIASDIAKNDICLIKIEGDNNEEALQQFKQFLETDFLACDEALPELTTSDQKPLPYMLRDEPINSFRGTSVSPGIAEGKAIHLGEPVLTLAVDAIESGTVAEEHDRFDLGRHHLTAVLEHQSENSHGEERDIVKAHLALLCDKDLIDSIQRAINEGESVLAAIINTQNYYASLIESSSNPYLRERVLDIKDICARLIIDVYGADSYKTQDNQLTSDAICIANNLAPSQFLELDRRFLKGLVLECGGSTSHTVILARSFGIPVLVGVENASHQIATDEHCIVDANQGLLIASPSQPVVRYYELEQSKLNRLAVRRERYLGEEACTLDGHIMEVAANIASPEEVVTALANGAQSIGLFRTEMLYMDRSTPPCEEEQLAIYSKALTAAGNDRPVIIRTMDIGGDKPVDYFNIAAEENPFLGYRAIRIYPEYLEYFHTQLRAILRASVHGHCKIMVPMVATVEEARWLRETYNDVLTTLAEQQIEHNSNVQLGIMLEVPSCAFIIDQLVRYVDFFSIGSNDLTQYFLAADRGNARVQSLYNSLNPAFLRQLKFIVDNVRKAGSWVGMCGEFAGDPAHLPLLLGLGLDEISLGATRIPEIKETISTLNTESCKALLAQALELETADEVRTLLQQSQQNNASHLPILAIESIVVDADCHSKAEVIKTLVDNLWINGRVADIQGAEQAIWDREVISPTMLGFGIAIPHCKSDSIAANTISIMKLKTPVLWNEGDDVLTDTVFMLTVRASEAGSTHMRIFAQLARRIMRDEFRASLASCTDQNELMAYISQELEL